MATTRVTTTFPLGARLRVATILITISEASEQFEVPAALIHTWLRLGKARRMGKQRAKMGRPHILVDPDEIADLAKRYHSRAHWVWKYRTGH